MEILVCIKQVPDDSVEISFNAAAGIPDTEGVTPVVNAFDTYALEMAVRLKEAAGGQVAVLSIGDETVKNSLKNCLAVGGDSAWLCRAEDAQKMDSVSTSKLLRQAVKAIEEKTGNRFDVIFCGRESTDFASAQVGIMLADELQAPVITDITGIEADIAKQSTFQIKRETEEGYQLMEAAAPCVVTVNKPNYDPRYPTIKSKMAARKKAIEELEAAAVPEPVVCVVKMYEPAKRAAGVKLKAATAEEAVAEAIAMMSKAKVI